MITTIKQTKNLKELKEHIYQLKEDCIRLKETLGPQILTEENEIKERVKNFGSYHFYFGEVNAFQIVLDLLEQCKGEN